MAEKKPKYLKIFQGIISGSMARRDDGFPETKYRVYSDDAQLARNFGTEKDEVIYLLTELEPKELEPLIESTLNKEIESKQKEEKEEIKNEIERLQKKLKNLNKN